MNIISYRVIYGCWIQSERGRKLKERKKTGSIFNNSLFIFSLLLNRCTVKSACQKATTSSPRWLAYGSGQQCIDFEQVLPDRIPIAQTAVVSIYFLYAQRKQN